MDLKTYVDAERGRASKLAAAIGIDPVLISYWANGVRQVPAERCLTIQQATDGRVTCKEMRPDLPWDVVSEPATKPKPRSKPTPERSTAGGSIYADRQRATAEVLARVVGLRESERRQSVSERANTPNKERN